MKFYTIRHKYWNLKDTICNFLNPKQKWITKSIPKHWCDKDELIRNLLFDILVHYVEEENGLQDEYDWDSDLEQGHVSKEYVNNVLSCDTALRAAYNYIKFERNKIKDDFYKAHKELLTCRTSGTIDDLFKKTDDNYFTPSKEYAEYLSKLNAINDDITKRDTEVLNTIIKYRESLWT